ncbi:MAG: DUF2891 domain-containing protein [Pseudomonadota bacterium]
MAQQLDLATARRFARLTLGHVTREWPNKLDHAMTGPGDVAGPRALHPIFFGSYDWHSCVHGWWQLFRLARRFPEMAEAAEIAALAETLFTPANVAVEVAYLERPASAGFERPYGWGWLLYLAIEEPRVAPLAAVIARRLHEYLPRATYPVRTGAHPNIAFAMVLARRWAAVHDPALVALIDASALRWFEADRDAQAWEPDGDAFLSPTLIEALLMQDVLGDGFAEWFDAFLPRAASREPATLFTPATVSDRTDGKIAHLDGLNLSRAWCWRGIAGGLGSGHPVERVALASAQAHRDAALPHLGDDYMGEHWLASFALLALDDAG